jgi:histidine phosphotransfer protein HptB
MDFKETAKNLGLEEDEFIEVLKLFVEVSQSDLEKMKSAIDSKDTRVVFESSHSIKGAAVNLGFQEIAQIARELELNARQDILDGSDRAYMILKEKIDMLSGCM